MRDPAHATAQLAQIDKSFPLPKNFTTVVGPDIATGDFQQRRFAGTMRTDHGPVLAGIDLPRHVRQDGLPARTEADIADLSSGAIVRPGSVCRNRCDREAVAVK